MAAQDQSAVVELKIPCRPEFVGVARLAILGVASRMPFSYDEVEDIRLAVGEACTAAVERAVKANQTDTPLSINSQIVDSKLTIDIVDEVTGPTPPPEETTSVEGVDDPGGIGVILMELLMDEVSEESIPGRGTRVRMIKYVG